MNDALRLILSMSLSASLLAIILLAVRPLTKNRLPKSVQYCLWVIVLLRLLLPMSFDGSLMDRLFYGSRIITTADYQTEAIMPEGAAAGSGDANTEAVQNAGSGGGANAESAGLPENLKDAFPRLSMLFWLAGALLSLSASLAGYARFLKHLKKANTKATVGENEMLNGLLMGRGGVSLARNRFAATPMLIGIFRPCIIIPDMRYTDNQLENILLHEITHMRRYDIAVKWLALIAVSVHWFNPLAYLIRRELSEDCELACDEAVILAFSPEEKQAYGETLIVASGVGYPAGVLQATMCEEKRNLKERLLSIMKHKKVSKTAALFSVLLIALVISGAWYSGAWTGYGKETSVVSPDGEAAGYDLDAISAYRTPYVGDSSKAAGIAGTLPVPDDCFIQRYISLKTDEEPYGMTIYYETAPDAVYQGEWPIVSYDSAVA